jgi:hypothetical protein
MLHRCFLLCLLRHWQFLSDENKMKAKKKALHSTLNKKKTKNRVYYISLLARHYEIYLENKTKLSGTDCNNL